MIRLLFFFILAFLGFNASSATIQVQYSASGSGYASAYQPTPDAAAAEYAAILGKAESNACVTSTYTVQSVSTSAAFLRNSYSTCGGASSTGGLWVSIYAVSQCPANSTPNADNSACTCKPGFTDKGSTCEPDICPKGNISSAVITLGYAYPDPNGLFQSGSGSRFTFAAGSAASPVAFCMAGCSYSVQSDNLKISLNTNGSGYYDVLSSASGVSTGETCSTDPNPVPAFPTAPVPNTSGSGGSGGSGSSGQPTDGEPPKDPADTTPGGTSPTNGTGPASGSGPSSGSGDTGSGPTSGSGTVTPGTPGTTPTPGTPTPGTPTPTPNPTPTPTPDPGTTPGGGGGSTGGGSVPTPTPTPTPGSGSGSASMGDLPATSGIYTPKYPGGVADVWSKHRAAFVQSGLGRAISKLSIDVPLSGAPPSLPVRFVIGKWDYGTVDLSPPASVWLFVKICVLISAVFLCRALIFGG